MPDRAPPDRSKDAIARLRPADSVHPLDPPPAASASRSESSRLGEADLESALAAGISTYADLDVDATGFETHLRALIARQRTSGADAQAPPLAGLVVADVYLAYACECGIEAAWERLQERFLVALTRRALRCRVGAVRAEAQAVALLGDLALPPPRGGW